MLVIKRFFENYGLPSPGGEESNEHSQVFVRERFELLAELERDRVETCVVIGVPRGIRVGRKERWPR